MAVDVIRIQSIVSVEDQASNLHISFVRANSILAARVKGSISSTAIAGSNHPGCAIYEHRRPLHLSGESFTNCGTRLLAYPVAFVRQRAR